MPLEFEEGDWVFVKISPRRDVFRSGKKLKLAPRFVRPFKIVERIGPKVYKLVLPPRLSHVQNVFHVLILRKFTPNSTSAFDSQEISIDANRFCSEEPSQILEFRECRFRNKIIPTAKVLWKHHEIEEATWEPEEEKRQHPQLSYNF